MDSLSSGLGYVIAFVQVLFSYWLKRIIVVIVGRVMIFVLFWLLLILSLAFVLGIGVVICVVVAFCCLCGGHCCVLIEFAFVFLVI